MLEPIRPDATTRGDHEPVETDVELAHELVQALVDEPHLDLTVADLLEMSCTWYGRSLAVARLIDSPRHAREAIRAGV